MTRAREEQIIEAAYKEAKARGLPDGWTCTIDVSCWEWLSVVLVDRITIVWLWLTPLSFWVDLLETQTPEMDSPQSWQIV